MICTQKCKSVITHCYILYNHISVVCLDTSYVEMEANIAILLPLLHCCVISPNAWGFHTKSKICKWWVDFSDNFSITAMAFLYTPSRKQNILVIFSRQLLSTWSWRFNLCVIILIIIQNSFGLLQLPSQTNMYIPTCFVFLSFLAFIFVTNEPVFFLFEGLCLTPLPAANTSGLLFSSLASCLALLATNYTSYALAP